jgi:predicted Zn finger-like uncharacterized protein
MKVICPGCNAQFAVDDNRIPPLGMQVRCPKCFKAIEVGGDSAPSTELEASLGIDLSGPDGDGEAVMDDGWGEAGDSLDVPTSAPAEPVPDASGSENSDWNELAPLSTQDISMIGTYEKVPEGRVLADNPWQEAPEAPQPATTADVESEQAFQPEPEKPVFAGEATAPDAIDKMPSQPAAEFSMEGTIGDDLDVPAAMDENLQGDDFGDPFSPPDSAPEAFVPDAPVSSEDEFQAEPESPVGFPEEDPEKVDFDSLKEFDDDDAFSGLHALGSAGDGAEAPDSIFAIEEKSGVFSAKDIIPDKTDPGLPDDDWGFGEADPEPGPGETLSGPPDFSSFERETVYSDEKLLEDLNEEKSEELARSQQEHIEDPAPAQSGPTLDDIDFASLLDEIPGDKKDDGEVFFVDSPSMPEDDFETPKAADSFSMEEISFDDLDALDEPSEDLGMENTGDVPSGDDDMFDLDMGTSDVSGGGSSLDADLPMPDIQPTTGQPAPDRPRPRRRKRGAGIGMLLVILVLGGAGFGAWQLGIFDTILGNQPKAPLKLPTKSIKKKESGINLLPSIADYDKRLQVLLKERELNSDSKVAVEEELLWVLAWYQFLFPDNFKSAKLKDKTAVAWYKNLKKSHAGQVFKLKAEAMELGGQGKWEDATVRFNEYMTFKARKMAELLEKNKITAQVAREDNLLNAWLAIESGRFKDAEGVLSDLLGEKAEEFYPQFLQARLFAAKAEQLVSADQKDKAAIERNRAIDRLRTLSEQFPAHIDTKLLLADQFASADKLDEALVLAKTILAAGKETKNYRLQVRAYRALADFLQKKNNPDELFKVLEQMKTDVLGKKSGIKEPEDLLLLLCKLYLDRDMIGQALGALELCGKNCSSPDYFLLLARSYESSKLLYNAIEKAKLGHEKYPKNAPLLMLLARLSKETGQTNSAVAYLEEILNLRPDNTEAALTLANLFLELKDPPNARKVLLEAERFVEDSLPLQEMLAQINEAMGDDPGTISALTKILELKKGKDMAIRKKLTGYLVNQGNYEDALVHFTFLEEKKMITPELRADYAKCLRATGRVQDALDILKELLRDNPGDAETARFLADIYLQKEDFFNAKLYLEATRRADTENPEVHYLIGSCCLKLQDQDCALEAFQKAVELDPEKLEYVEQLANLLFERGQAADKKLRREFLKKSRKYFQYIISRYEDKEMPTPEDRRNADVYFNHGQILFETGYFDKALVDLDKAMFLAKHRFDILVTYADTLYKMNRYNEAVKYYQEMLDSNIEKAHAYFYLGKIHLIKGKREKAKSYFNNCIALEPKAFPDAHKRLGDIFREKGLRKKAIDHYRTYLKLLPKTDPAALEVANILRKM